MSEVDGVGGLVTGAMVAGAVEPDTGKVRDDGPGGNCLNCGASLTGPYCNQCGQRGTVHRSLRAYFGDLAANLFNFEGKFFRTLPMLVWKPGELTRRYIEGERASFISPIALYLFSVFAMFAVLNFNGALDSDIGGSVDTNLKEAVATQEKQVAELEERRARRVRNDGDVAEIDKKLAEAREDLADLKNIRTAGIVTVDGGDNEKLPPWMQDVIGRAQNDPDKLVFNITDAASKYSWLLIPISVPFLWLLFPLRRRHHLYDHAVFVTYSLSFMMMLVVVAGLLVWGNAPVLASLLFFVPPIHMYRQLKGAYQLGRLSALVRTAALVTFAFVAITFFTIAIVGLGTFS